MIPFLAKVGNLLIRMRTRAWRKGMDERGEDWRARYNERPFARFHGARRLRNLRTGKIHPESRFFTEVQRLASPRVLEIGSRRIVCTLDKAQLGVGAAYVGLDIMAGPNVDVVGDVHELSKLFPAESFDAVYSTSVFEHIAIPWQVIREIHRILKPGGLVYIGTHHAYPVHELPWDFWRYGRDAFRTIFSPARGFEVLDDGLEWSAVLVKDRQMWTQDQEKDHYLFTVLLAQKTGAWPADPSAWELDYRCALPGLHHYPKGTSQLAAEKAATISEFEYTPPRKVTMAEWTSRLRETLGASGEGLLVCGPNVEAAHVLSDLPKSWHWSVTVTPAVSGSATQSLDLPRRQFDAVLAFEPRASPVGDRA